MKVIVKAFKFVNGSPDKFPCKEFDVMINSPYDPYEESKDFLKELCYHSAQWVGTDGLIPFCNWQSKQEKGCAVIVNFVDGGGVAKNIVTIKNGELTSSRESLKKCEGKFLLQVSWK